MFNKNLTYDYKKKKKKLFHLIKINWQFIKRQVCLDPYPFLVLTRNSKMFLLIYVYQKIKKIKKKKQI